MRVDAVAGYLSAVRRAARVRRPPLAGPHAVGVGGDRLLWRRLVVTHAASRLPAGSHAVAAWGGLQDSAPRAALLALHARMDGVDPGGWEHPDLVQVWLRWADYVVPRADAGVFTIGALPRDDDARRALDHLGRAVVDALGDRSEPTDVVARRLGLDDPLVLRAVAVTGHVRIRWDARTTRLIAADVPAVDADEARLELARRFVHWLGPATSDHLARWAGVTREDAALTWERLRSELEPVAVDGRERWLLRDDVDALVGATPPSGVRLLPQGDPCLFMVDDLGPRPRRRAVTDEDAVTTRLVNGLTGRILCDGAIVGAWGRTSRAVTIDAWTHLSTAAADAVDRASHDLAAPMGGPIDVRWLPPPSP